MECKYIHRLIFEGLRYQRAKRGVGLGRGWVCICDNHICHSFTPPPKKNKVHPSFIHSIPPPPSNKKRKKERKERESDRTDGLDGPCTARANSCPRGAAASQATSLSVKNGGLLFPSSSSSCCCSCCACSGSGWEGVLLGGRWSGWIDTCVNVCERVCVCVCVRGGGGGAYACVCECECVHVCLLTHPKRHNPCPVNQSHPPTMRHAAVSGVQNGPLSKCSCGGGCCGGGCCVRVGGGVGGAAAAAAAAGGAGGWEGG